MILVAPVLLFTGIIGAASSIVQIGFLQVEDAVSPNFEKFKDNQENLNIKNKLLLSDKNFSFCSEMVYYKRFRKIFKVIGLEKPNFHNRM